MLYQNQPEVELSTYKFANANSTTWMRQKESSSMRLNKTDGMIKTDTIVSAYHFGVFKETIQFR